MGLTTFEKLVFVGITGDVVITLVILVVIARWILRPLDQLVGDLRKRSAGSGSRPTQFTILDLLCLFVLIQPPMALLHAPGWSVVPKQAYWLFDLFIWGSCGAMWWASVRMLSQAQIGNPWHRGLYLGLILPAVYFSGRFTRWMADTRRKEAEEQDKGSGGAGERRK